MNQQQVYQQLHQTLSQHLNKANRWQIDNQALMTQALAFSPDCHLANLALYLPVEGQRENLVQRMRRWLKNQKATQKVCYSPLVRHLLRHWPQHDEVSLVMDRTDLGHKWSILMVSIAYRHRSLPLVWQVQPFGGTGQELQEELLREITPALAPLQSRRITLYGDSEFRAVDLQRYCRDQRWHWYLGLKSDILYRQAAEDWQPLSTIPIERGQRRYLHDIYLTKQHTFGPVHLLVDWTQKHDKPRYFVSDQKTSRHSWRRGRKRFWIEPSFRDWKSYGFDLETSKIECPNRLTMLLLNMATASLWLTSVGQWVQATGRNTLLEAEHKRDYSIFRLGRDYARRSLVCNWPLPIDFALRH
jgi:hypothetical protein